MDRGDMLGTDRKTPRGETHQTRFAKVSPVTYHYTCTPQTGNNRKLH
jgi:hypothetical protein